MGTLKVREFFSAALTILFFGLCLHFAKKAEEGPWHAVAVQLWEKQEWNKLRALGQNLTLVGKEDVETFYLAMMASEQLEDVQAAKLFASRLSDSRVLNWKLEKQIAKSYRPNTLRKRIALFRTRLIFLVSVALFAVLIVFLRRKEPYELAPALLSSAGIVILML